MPEDQSVGLCLMRYSTADLFFGVVSPSLFPSMDNPQGSGVGVGMVPGRVHSSVGLQTIPYRAPYCS